MGLFEPQHILLILLVLVLFFGGKKIPELMRGLGKGVKEFKDAQNGNGEGGATPNSTTTSTTAPTEEKPKN